MMCAHVCSLTRLALLLLVLHYVVEMIFHTSRLLYFSDKAEIANYGYVFLLIFLLCCVCCCLCNVLFVLIILKIMLV